MRAMFTRMLTLSLLIFALLLTQLGGLTHAISHIPDGHGEKSTLSHEKHCDLCAAYAQLGSALSSKIMPVAQASHEDHYSLEIPSVISSLSFAAFAARAPPYSA